MSETPPQLFQHHIDDLRRSGLTDETIRLAQVYSLRDPERISQLLGWEFPAKAMGPCLVFPFFDLAGEPTGYSPVEAGQPRAWWTASRSKYESPFGRAEPDLPPTPRPCRGQDPDRRCWSPRARRRHSRPTSTGTPASGWSGCGAGSRSGRPRDERPRSPPRPEGVHFRGRRVYVVFDSDSVYKDDVQFAEWELAQGARETAARRCSVVRLPCQTRRAEGRARRLPPRPRERKRSTSCCTRPRHRPLTPSSGFSNMVFDRRTDKPNECDTVPRSVAEMAAELVGKSGGWPRRVAGSLVVPDQAGGVRAVANPDQLFAFAGGVFARRWRERHRVAEGGRVSLAKAGVLRVPRRRVRAVRAGRLAAARPADPERASTPPRPRPGRQVRGARQVPLVLRPRDRRGRLVAPGVPADAALGRAARQATRVPVRGRRGRRGGRPRRRQDDRSRRRSPASTAGRSTSTPARRSARTRSGSSPPRRATTACS